MKNKFLMVLAILGIMTLTYCGSPKSEESEEAATETEAVEPEAEEAAEEETDDMEEGSEEGEVETDTTASE